MTTAHHTILYRHLKTLTVSSILIVGPYISICCMPYTVDTTTAPCCVHSAAPLFISWYRFLLSFASFSPFGFAFAIALNPIHALIATRAYISSADVALTVSLWISHKCLLFANSFRWFYYSVEKEAIFGNYACISEYSMSLQNKTRCIHSEVLPKDFDP